jgi:tRNA (mo5U34)-methyltransferase
LGDGLVTPGDFDYRPSLPLFQFPEDMRGMTVLDVGSATGFFAFEFEKRGASVILVELPSIADWDMPGGEDRE